MKILVLNSGSSSLKYQVIDTETGEMLVKGYYERIGQVGAFLTHKVNGEKHHFEHPAKNHEKAIQFVMKRLTSDHYGVFKSLDELDAIGHRVVHGGEKFKDAVLITEEVIKEIEATEELAPLHNPAAILGIEACQKVVPNKPMVAVFDTAFHQTISKEKYIYPIPYEYYEKYHVRKYGFHGTSHQYVANRVAEILGKDIKELKIVNCHLGQGASICAIKNGESVETSMGLTPLGGVPMGTRSGDLDPSVVTYLMSKENMNPAQIDEILNKRSGLLALSGISSDNRDVERAIAQGDERAISSLKEYDFIIAQYIAKMAVTMNGVDVITFTAGVGEKGPISRAGICSHLTFMGVLLDPDKNNSVRDTEKEISSENSRVKVWVVPTNEELMIARETMELVK